MPSSPSSPAPCGTLRPDQGTPPGHRIYVGVLTQVAPHPHADREVVVAVDASWGAPGRRYRRAAGGAYVPLDTPPYAPSRVTM